MTFTLPVNKPQVPKDTPRNFFIYGETMTGKSYLANEFPNPIVLNTDGNAEANTVPSIALVNVKNEDGKIVESVIDQLSDILLALQTQKHSYETVILDVIDDVIELIKFAVCDQFGVKALSEVQWGKGYDYFNQALTELIMDLKALPMNVIYISRLVKELDEKGNVKKEVPSLKDKYVNLINGNSDLMIKTEKIGNNYNREVDRKRKTYYADQVDDKAILKILATIRGAVEPAKVKPIPKKEAAKTTKPAKAEKPKGAPKKEVASDDELF
ncbi:AAA family ATPase [Streptococcus pneumoniae]|nr:AAA family ATPase [Streptococcus pneumoniae]